MLRGEHRLLPPVQGLVQTDTRGMGELFGIQTAIENSKNDDGRNRAVLLCYRKLVESRALTVRKSRRRPVGRRRADQGRRLMPRATPSRHGAPCNCRAGAEAACT